LIHHKKRRETVKNYKLRLVTFVILAGLISASYFNAYGLTSSNSSGKIDAIASATTAPVKPAVKPTVKPLTVAPPKATVTKPLPVPVPIPIPEQTVPVTVIPTIKETGLNLLVNGKVVDLTGSPIILATDGKAMLPLRKLGDALGYTVKWDDQIKAAVLQKNTESIIISNESLNYSWGSLTRVFSKKPENFKNRLYVPMDFITGNTNYQLNQTTASITVDLAGTAVKLVLTGEIEKIATFTNGLGLTVKDNKNALQLLYVTEKTKVTNYTTGAAIDSSLLKVGTKAIFSFIEVPGEDKATYNVLSSVEVVDGSVIPATVAPKESEEDDD
jgi:hypothetical protein